MEAVLELVRLLREERRRRRKLKRKVGRLERRLEELKREPAMADPRKHVTFDRERGGSSQ